jgi:hypothetical protein
MHAFFIDDPKLRGKGMALDALARSTSNQSISSLSMEAVRYDAPGSKMNGYKVWPRYGWDAPISAVREAVDRQSGGEVIPQEFSKCKSLLDILAKKGGPEWWSKNGGDIALHFDNRRGSRSRAVLEAAIREAAKKHGENK